MSEHNAEGFRVKLAKPIVISMLVIYWVALAVGTHIPVENVPDVPTSDKLLHFGAYFGLSVLVHLTLEVCGRRPYWLVVVCGLMIYGAVDEWLQIPVGRSCELADWFADVAGVVAGTAAFKAGMLLIVRRPSTKVESRAEL